MKRYLNTQSIFFKLNALFAMAIIILIISGFSTFNFFLKGHQKNMALKYIYIDKAGISSEILDILDLVNEEGQKKNNSSFGLKIIMKIFGSIFFSNAGVIMTHFNLIS